MALTKRQQAAVDKILETMEAMQESDAYFEHVATMNSPEETVEALKNDSTLTRNLLRTGEACVAFGKAIIEFTNAAREK